MTNARLELEATAYGLRGRTCTFAEWLEIRGTESGRAAVLLERLMVPWSNLKTAPYPWQPSGPEEVTLLR